MKSRTLAKLVTVGEGLEEFWSITAAKGGRYRVKRQLFPLGGYGEFARRLLKWAGARDDGGASRRWTHALDAGPVIEFASSGSENDALEFFVDSRSDRALRVAALLLVQDWMKQSGPEPSPSFA